MSNCIICFAELSHLSELEQITHIDICLETKLEPNIPEVDLMTESQLDHNYYSMAHHPDDFYEECEPVVETMQEFKTEAIEPIQQMENIDLTGMPDYAKMSVGEIKAELDKYGMKKTLDVKSSREILKQT